MPFVAELMKTISIDGWGSCTDKIQRLYPEVKAHSMENNSITASQNLSDSVLSKYKFWLITDPYRCEDSVSPFFWRALSLGIIPVVIGTTNILEFSPAVGATIDASVYTSASILAEELKTLNENDGMFWARTAFKSNPGLIKTQFKQLLASFSVSPEADICDFLTSHGFKKNSREKYLHSDHTCQFPSILTS